MTTKDAIKQLPIEDELKLQVLRLYDYMEPDQKLIIERTAWNAYFIMQKETIQQNIELQFEKVEKGEAELGEDFYADVVKETDKEMVENVQNAKGSVDLAVARKAMQQIVKEMQDAKDVKAEKKLAAHKSKN
jgi:hypothetical protein